MVQRRGGTVNVQHAFAHQRGKNSKSTIRNCNQTLGQDAGVKSTTYLMRAKSNTSGDNFLYINELKQTLPNKSKHNNSK